MEVAKTIESIRSLVKAAHSRGKKIGLVPTMGALHIGHISLIEAAVKKCEFVVVSIFVNPTQFGPGEDFEKYPRPLEADLEICRKAGVDVVFAPEQGQMYGSENLTWVNVEKLTEPLCGQFRPGHFRGVATVCAKLFNIVEPNIAFLGQKDAQQAIVIKQMVADLNMPLEIVVCPTVRQPDGLAVSSRNKYLTEREKKNATYVYKSLQKCREMIETGITDTRKIISQMRKILNQAPSIKIEYIRIVDAETLQSLDHIAGKPAYPKARLPRGSSGRARPSGRVLAAVAVGIGSTRLIDNIFVAAGKQ